MLPEGDRLQAEGVLSTFYSRAARECVPLAQKAVPLFQEFEEPLQPRRVLGRLAQVSARLLDFALEF